MTVLSFDETISISWLDIQNSLAIKLVTDHRHDHPGMWRPGLKKPGQVKWKQGQKGQTPMQARLARAKEAITTQQKKRTGGTRRSNHGIKSVFPHEPDITKISKSRRKKKVRRLGPVNQERERNTSKASAQLQVQHRDPSSGTPIARRKKKMPRNQSHQTKIKSSKHPSTYSAPVSFHSATNWAADHDSVRPPQHHTHAGAGARRRRIPTAR